MKTGNKGAVIVQASTVCLFKNAINCNQYDEFNQLLVKLFCKEILNKRIFNYLNFQSGRESDQTDEELSRLNEVYFLYIIMCYDEILICIMYDSKTT